jgi:beta-glucosidase-like glycosyl hydrolase
MKLMLVVLCVGMALAAPVDPKAAAAAMVEKMTLDEKVILLHGTGAGYTGNTPAIPRLGIPPLNMNDGPQGYRSGGTTAFPSGLTAAASFSRKSMGDWGSAMGEEFFGKGANVQLGPGLCVARVPRNGRNFEYLSGEDPYLGFELVQPVIKGIQSKGVIANAKHWIMNNQETDRSGGNEVVDDRTRWEMYYPPFLGAIKAEVGSFMCSYNRINGAYSCENNGTLATDLKKTAGFEGWIMSDWGATHSMSINQGLDQEMPGGGFMGAKLKAAVQDGTVSQATLDDSVKRILTQMYKFKLFDNINQWNGSTHSDDVTTLAHSQIARNVSAAATVLLTNKNGILPLKQGTKIALIGSDSVDPLVHGGGSGQVEPMYTISPFMAIATRNTGRVPASGAPKMPDAKCTVLDNDFDYFIQPSQQLGGTFASADACCQGCGTIPGTGGKPKWLYFTWTGNGTGHQSNAGASCWCHQGQGQKKAAKGYVSGSCATPPAPPAPPAPVQCGGTLIQNTDFNTPDSAQLKGTFAAPADCCAACGKNSGLWLYFTRTSGSDCWCHKSDRGKDSNNGYTSGSCRKPPPPPPAPSTATVTTYTGTDPTEAAAVAAAADVAIVFVSSTSSEGSDRSSLSFADSQNALVDAVAKVQKGTVVVMVNPGAVLTPWTDDVAAALTMFMPGLEMGNALSDVLYGDVNPSGRLPLTFPNKENEVSRIQAHQLA